MFGKVEEEWPTAKSLRNPPSSWNLERVKRPSILIPLLLFLLLLACGQQPSRLQEASILVCRAHSWALRSINFLASQSPARNLAVSSFQACRKPTF